ncbi:hypothetical protein, partial [Agrilactobacillus composti]
MKKKILGFILLVASALLFVLIPAKPVLADDEVVIPVRDSSFLTLNEYNYKTLVSGEQSYFNSYPIEDSYVPGLSTWKLSKLYTGSWSGGEADPWYKLAREIYEVGPDMFLTNFQAIRIPTNKITFKEIGVYRGKDFNDDSPWKMIFHSYYIVTVKNNGPVTLWQSPAY